MNEVINVWITNTHLEPSRTCIVEDFCKIVNGFNSYFYKKAPSQMFYWVLNELRMLEFLSGKILSSGIILFHGKKQSGQQKAFPFMQTVYEKQNTRFFISSTLISNTKLKMDKNQTKDKQYLRQNFNNLKTITFFTHNFTIIVSGY